MSSLSAESMARLTQLAGGAPGSQPIPLAVGSTMGRPLRAVVVTPEALVPVGEDFRPLAPIEFEQIERALVREDVGSRYVVDLSLVREGDDPSLVFDSRCLFLMVFSALRARDVACRFDFTKERQSRGTATAARRILRWVAALAASAAAFGVCWPDGEIGTSLAGTGLGALFIVGLVALVPLGVMMAIFSSVYDPGERDGLLPLMTPADPPNPEVAFDDRTLGAELIAGESYSGVRVAPARPAQGEQERQISDLERMLE